MTLLALSNVELKGLMILTLIGCSVVASGWLYLYFGPCKTKLDLLFLIDTSKSVTNSNLYSVTSFCKDIINHKNIHLKPSSVKVGFSRFSLQADWLNSSYKFVSSKNDVKEVLSSLNSTNNPFLRINTNTSAALEFVKNRVQNQTRPNSRKTVIIITDGVSDVRNIYSNGTCRITKITDKKGRQVCPRTSLDDNLLFNQSGQLINEGFSILAIQIGNSSQSQLHLITQDPSKIYTVGDYDSLGEITDILSKSFCRKSWWIIFVPGVFTLMLISVKLWLGYAEAKEIDKATLKNIEVLNNKRFEAESSTQLLENLKPQDQDKHSQISQKSQKARAPPPPR